MRLATKTPLDKLLEGGIECDGVTNIYGPAGSGKTNIAISATLANEKKTVYIDTEGSFSLDRFFQLGGSERHLKRLLFIEPASWKMQHENVLHLDKILEKEPVGLIVIDSIVALYRLELDDTNYQAMNRQLATQYSVLSQLSRTHKIPVLVTNQVYGTEERIEITSRTVAKYWSKTLVELKKTEHPNHRVAFLRRHRSLPEGKHVEFVIEKDRLKETGRFVL